MTTTINPEYKDRLFKRIFGTEDSKENILSLYNALNSSDYTNPEEIEINTLEDTVFIGMKNDVSFLLDSYLTLWEQQSTFSINMPLRGLMYFVRMYRAYIEKHNQKKYLYSKKLIKLPTPRFVVFYNGTDEMPEVVKLKLSDAFMVPDDSGEFEWTATMYNLNIGKNKELLSKCKPLADYMRLIELMREYQAKGYENEEAANLAVEQCIKEGVLIDFLRKHRAEVSEMLLTEFDEKAFREGIHEEGYDEGLKDGKLEGRNEGRIEVLIGLVKDKIINVEEAAKRAGISGTEFEKYLSEYTSK